MSSTLTRCQSLVHSYGTLDKSKSLDPTLYHIPVRTPCEASSCLRKNQELLRKIASLAGQPARFFQFLSIFCFPPKLLGMGPQGPGGPIFHIFLLFLGSLGAPWGGPGASNFPYLGLLLLLTTALTLLLTGRCNVSEVRSCLSSPSSESTNCFNRSSSASQSYMHK